MRTISRLLLLLLFISLLSHHRLVLVVHGAELDSAAAENTKKDATTTTTATSDSTDPDVTKDSTESTERKSKDTVVSSAFKDASTKSVTSTSSTKTTNQKTTTSTTANDIVDETTLDVINLNSRNFGRHLSDRNVVWLIEFYSPHCSHCVEFAASYADIARHYHSRSSSSSSSSSSSNRGTTQRSKQRRIKVAKVNGEIERALVSRFSISAYPCFFVVDGFRVYKYEGLRLKKNIMAFVEGGYKKESAISFVESPMGPLGIFQGSLLSMGHLFLDIFQWSQVTFGLSPLIVGMILFGIMFLGCFFFIVSLALIIPEKPKRA